MITPSRRVFLPLAALAACAPLQANLASAQGRDEIHIRSVGEGASTWVLLHPFAASGRFWDDRAAALAAQHGVRVLSPDMPSHGRSRIVQRFEYDAASDAVERALAPHRASISLIVGASSGGIVALKLAARLRKPVVGVAVGYSFSAQNVANLRAVSREVPEGTAQYIAPFLEQGDTQRAALQRHFGDLADVGEAPLFSVDEMAALAGRLLILNGSQDGFFSPPSAHALANAIPRSVLSFETGAGHLDPFGPDWRDHTWASVAAFLATRTAN